MEAAVHRVRRWPWMFAAACVLIQLSQPAFAQGPDSIEALGPINPDTVGNTPTSVTVGPRVFQVETGVSYGDSALKGNSPTQMETPTLIRYGIGQDWEVRLESQGLRYTHRTPTTVPESGTLSIGAPSVGFKWHFQDPRPSNYNWSLGAIIRVLGPPGDVTGRRPHTYANLRLAADWNAGPAWALNVNAGVSIGQHPKEDPQIRGGIASTLTYGTGNLQPFVNFGFLIPDGPGSPLAAQVSGGVSYLLDVDTQLQFGPGSGFAGSTTSGLTWTLNVSHRFRPLGS